MRSCIYCKSDKTGGRLAVTEDSLDLGYMHPSQFVEDDFLYSKAEQFETKLVTCKQCHFVQLTEAPDLDLMYKEQYWYRSGLNASMVGSLSDVVQAVYKRYPAITNGFRASVLDIASNDGTLLNFYPKHWFRVGVDPANNLRNCYTKDNCDLFINDYFKDNLVFPQKFDIITSIAMFYDLLDPHSFVQGIANNLSKDGIWVCQFTDLTCMMMVNAWDSICAEHFGYWTTKHFIDLVDEFELKVFDIEYNNVNGKSVRYYVCKKGSRDEEPSVDEAQWREREILHPKMLTVLDNAIVENGNKLFSLLNNLVSAGKEVCGLGASTKGNTLLQTYGLNSLYLSCIGEVSKEKWGKFTVGSHIPIISESDMYATKPDYIFVLIWHFIDGIIKNSPLAKKFLEEGGKFIVPLPKPAIISKDGTEYL